MSARFKFAYSCSPIKMPGRDRQTVRQTISALLVPDQTIRTAIKTRKSRSTSTHRQIAEGPRTHL